MMLPIPLVGPVSVKLAPPSTPAENQALLRIGWVPVVPVPSVVADRKAPLHA